jgi:hypothetical protein
MEKGDSFGTMSLDSHKSQLHPSGRENPLHRSVTLLQSFCASDDDSNTLIRHTREYRDFVQALEQLELVHRNISSSWNDSPDATSWNHAPSISFLQYIATDDMIFRIFSFLESVSLLNAGTSCTRFRELANAHALEQSRPLVTRRQISSPMVLLKAYEQVMMGDSAFDNASSTEQIPMGVVPIPTLLLPKCIRVRDCGDTDYNGIYYCTGCNGNGYVFTKPRHPIQQRPMVGDTDSTRRNDDWDTAECHGAESGEPLRCIIAKRFSEEVRVLLLDVNLCTVWMNRETKQHPLERRRCCGI